MKIVFAGTPDFAAECLTALIGHSSTPTPHQANDASDSHTNLNIVAVYTQPDRPAGRGRKLQMSSVKSVALEANIPCEQPASLKDETALATLQSYQADLMIVVAYGLILPKSVLDSFPLGCINVHASLLPKWRGAAPIQRSIAAGETETGITIMQMDEGLDTGDMLLKASIPIENQDTGGTLHDKLAKTGASLLIDGLQQMQQGTLQATPQDNALATYAHKLSKQEARVDWTQSSSTIHHQIRAFNPWPVSYTMADDTRIRLWTSKRAESTTSSNHIDSDTDSNVNTTAQPGTIVNLSKESIDVATGEGIVSLLELQLSGGKRISVHSLINANYDWVQVGFVFS